MRRAGDDGSAVVEVVWLVLLLLVPLVYVLLGVVRVQAASFAVTEGARQAGRAWVTADDASQGRLRGTEAVRLSLADHGLPGAAVTTVSCAPGPCLTPGGRVRVTVRYDVALPGLPALFGVRARVPVQARHDAVVDRYREAP